MVVYRVTTTMIQRLTRFSFVSLCTALLVSSFASNSTAQSNHQLSSADWSNIKDVYEAARHAAGVTENGLQFRNPGQQWKTEFDGRGFVVRPDSGKWSWGLELTCYGWGDDHTNTQMADSVGFTGQEVCYKWDDTLTEWYKNEKRGLEHGYTVHHRPAGAKGAMVLELAVRGDLLPLVQSSGLDVQFVDRSNGTVLNYSGLSVVDVDGKAIPARFEYANARLLLTVNDATAHYPITIDPIAQQAYLKASNTESFDSFGYSVAVSGNTVVVGAYDEDSNATGVNGDDTNNSASSSGAAYVFVRNGSTWTQQAYLKASNTGMFDNFGWSVAIAGDTIAVAAIGEDSSSTGVNGGQGDSGLTESGAVYVYVRSAGVWSQQAYLKASNTDGSDAFGYSVSISGDTILVGAPYEDSNATGVNGNQSNNSAPEAGSVYVFTRSGSTWSQQAYIKASNSDSGDVFGWSVSLSGESALIGAINESSSATGVGGNQSNNSAAYSGAAYVFVRNGTTWAQQAYLKASNTGSFDQFGTSAFLSGNTAVVGSPNESSNATGVNGNQSDDSSSSSGAAYVFVRSGTVWSQQAYLKASNTGTFDQFGTVVAISGDTIIVGSPSESCDATGINGTQTNDFAPNAGAAYIFHRSGSTWTQQAYLKASNTDANDRFGTSVGISGDFVIVGSPYEDSSSIGVNGNQTNNNAFGSGASYIFDIDNNPGMLVYGTGTPGCAGVHTPGMTHAPMIGTPSFAITCSNAPPFSLGLGLVTDSQDLPGSDQLGVGILIHSDLAFATEVMTFDFFSDGTGYSETVGTGIPNDTNLIGKSYYACAIWGWTSCTLPGFNPFNLSSSKGLAITILAP